MAPWSVRSRKLSNVRKCQSSDGCPKIYYLEVTCEQGRAYDIGIKAEPTLRYEINFFLNNKISFFSNYTVTFSLTYQELT
jgi:hypothetical protein